MFSTQAMFPYLFLFVAVLAVNQVRSDSSEEEEKVMMKCMEDTGTKIEEIQVFRTDQVSEKMLCFMKCKYENEGLFSENGILIKEAMQESYDDFGWNEEQRTQADKCLDDMTAVKECEDLSSFFSCIPVINFGELI